MSEPNRSSWGVWWSAVAIALLVAYTLSAGPVGYCLNTWYYYRGPLPVWFEDVLLTFYYPIILAMEDGPDWLKLPLEVYLNLWGA